MPYVTEKQVDRALEILTDVAKEAARARAAHEHHSDMDKVLLAQLALRAPDDLKSQAARETWARAHADYEQHLAIKRELAELDYTWRDRRAAASAIIEMWRTEQSNERASRRVV